MVIKLDVRGTSLREKQSIISVLHKIAKFCETHSVWLQGVLELLEWTEDFPNLGEHSRHNMFILPFSKKGHDAWDSLLLTFWHYYLWLLRQVQMAIVVTTFVLTFFTAVNHQQNQWVPQGSRKMEHWLFTQVGVSVQLRLKINQEKSIVIFLKVSKMKM